MTTRKTAISLALVGLAFYGWAERVSSDLAARAVNKLIAQDDQMECSVKGTVSSVRLCTATNGAAFYVARLTGGGFVVTSTDTEIDPVVAISSEADLVEDFRNPLWSLLVGDMAARMEAVEEKSRSGARLTSVAAPRESSMSSSAARWASLTASESRLQSSGRSKISDVRVAPLLKTKWGQSDVAGRPCFNYYTPGHYVCGCAATAAAQILRYHKFPKAAVEPHTFKVSVSGRQTALTQKGGVYDWDSMPYVPGSTTTTAQRKAIGKLTYDVGLAVNGSYSPDETWGYLGSFVDLCIEWGYAHASLYHESGWKLFAKSHLYSVLIPNLSAKLPVGVGLRGSSGGGHYVVADGYGYLDGLFSVHLNFGWDGNSDAWYVLPGTISEGGYAFPGVEDICGNIYPNGPERGGIVSGRVLSSSTKKPVSGIVVTATNSSGEILRTKTDAKGIYAFILPAGDGGWWSSYDEDEWEVSLENASPTSYSLRIWDDENYYDQDFSVRLHTVKFDANGGSGTTSRTCNVLGTLPTTKRTGYTFEGWFTEPGGGVEVTETTWPTGNVTYYAHWKAIPYTVMFNANGGEGEMAPMAFLYDETQALSLNEFLRDDVPFRGWSLSPRGLLAFSDGEMVNNLTAVSNGVVTLYAVWYGDVVTAATGDYIKAPLAVLGYDVPTDGKTPYEVKAYGLPAGLKLKCNAAVKDKKGKVVKKAKVEWWIEGVPTAALDFLTKPAYLVITANGRTETLPLLLETLAQDVKDLGEIALGTSVNTKEWLTGVGAGWSVSGLPAGLKFASKKITATSGKKPVTVAEAYSVYGKTTRAGLFTITAKKKKGAYYETKKYRLLVTPKSVDAARFGEDLTNITTMAYVPFDWGLTNDVSSIGGKVAKVAGLPAGLTFAAADTYAYKNAKKKTGKYLKQPGQTIVGTPTKPGTYVVTFTKNVKSGKTTVAKTAQILWRVIANDAPLSLGFNEAGGVVESGTVGLKYGDLLAFNATEGAKITASGLPTGIKLVDLGGGEYAFVGFTTKAGTYLVTVTATLKGKTVRQRLALKVGGLPAWAKGSFNGSVRGAGNGEWESEVTNGLAAITVSSVGKISGKFQELGTNWTFSATSYTARSAIAPYQDAFICSNIVAKYAYKVKSGKTTVTKYVTRPFQFAVSSVPVVSVVSDVPDVPVRGVVTMTEEDGSTIEAWQNLWGRANYKALGQDLFYTSKAKPYRTFTIKGASEEGAAMGLAPQMTLALKVTPNGVAIATMSFDTGRTKKDPKTKKTVKIIYKATCQTVVIPCSPADAETFEGVVLLYFAPSLANDFEGFAGSVVVP